MFRTNERNRIESLNEAVNGDKQVIEEGKANANSVNALFETLWVKFVKQMAKSSGKRARFGKPGMAGSSTQMVSFEGYTKSDHQFDGWVSMYTDFKKSDIMVINISFKSVYGNSEEAWSFGFGEDSNATATMVGSWIKAFSETK